MTLTLAAVFAPLAFTPGRTGRLFGEFALTLAGAVLVSGFVALTLTPMMCSKLLRHNPAPNRFDRGMEAVLIRLNRRLPGRARLGARPALDRAAGDAGLRRTERLAVPADEERTLADGGPRRHHHAGARPGRATLEFTARYLDAIDAIGATYPEFDRRFMFQGGGQVSQASAVFRAVDWSERTRTTQELARDMLPKVSALPGVTAFPITPPSLGQGFRSRRSSSWCRPATATPTWHAWRSSSSPRWRATPASCNRTSTCS